MEFLEKIRPIEKFLIIDQIIEKVALLIEDGYLRPGDALPGERVLSEKLGVSRTSLRQALKALNFLGVLEIAPGKKTIIGNSFTNILKNPFRFIKAVHSIKLDEIFEARRVLEEGIVKIAVDKIGSRDVEKIRFLLKESENNLDKKSEFVYSEFNLHQCIFDIADNKILTAIMNSLNDLLLVLEKYEKDYLSQEDRVISFQQHSSICEAIIGRDVDLARNNMDIHLDTMEKRLKKLDL
jgi:GntR family transcriptional regulator, transcriptional repressor for pyruvate dehydrogenase complex